MGRNVVRGAIAIIALTAITSSSPIHADVIARPSASPYPDTFKGTMDQFRVLHDEYLELIFIRTQQMKLINRLFKNAIEKTNIEYRSAMAVAKNLDQRSLAASQRKAAVAAAIIARDASITALGPEPTPPPEPQKMKKSPIKSKVR